MTKDYNYTEQQLAIIDKYERLTRELMRSVDSGLFIKKKWLIKSKVSNEYFISVVQNGFLKTVGTRGRTIVFEANYKPEEINREHAILIYKTASELSKERIDSYKERTEKKEPASIVKKSEPLDELSTVSVKRILSELKKRGYEGEIRRIEELKF